MKEKSPALLKTAKILNIFAIVCSILILVSLSYDILYGFDINNTPSFMRLQLFVCIIFLLDWFVRLYMSEHKWRFLAFNWIILIVSIPYLNIIALLHLSTDATWWLAAKSAPLIRGFYALFLIASWMTRRSAAKTIAISYLFALLGFTYLSALVFYAVEKSINAGISNFGECLWWAFMNVTTVGANIYAVTPIGKILSVLLPFLGMIMLPIFTAYAIEFFKTRIKK